MIPNLPCSSRFFFSPVVGVFLLLILGFQISFGQAPVDIARQHIQEQRTQLGLSEADVAEILVTDNYVSHNNPTRHIYVRQAYQGIGISDGLGHVHLSPDGTVVYSGIDFRKDIQNKINTTTPVLSQMDAIQRAAQEYGMGKVGDLPILQAPIGPEQIAIFGGEDFSDENITIRLTFAPFKREDLRLAWDLSIFTPDQKHWYSLKIDAVNGDVLEENEWVVECDLGHAGHKNFSDLNSDKVNIYCAEPGVAGPGVQASCGPLAPAPAPAPNSYTVFADPVESPNHGGRTIVSSPWVVAASPFGWHDTNGAAGPEYTITRGNNVWAQEDQNGNNGTGFSPNGGGTLDFAFPLNLNAQPNTYTSAAITNLFFWNNRMHDVWYAYGFDEPSGNFQQNNYGNGGTGADYVLADGQDGSGMDNANFSTPADGTRPRMQMYLWTGQVTSTLLVNSPAGIAGTYDAMPAGFGPALPVSPLTANLELANDGTGSPTEACNALINGGSMVGKIALVDRGTCPFVNKVLNAQNEGAVACIVCNNDGGAPFTMGGATGSITIPSVMISQADCAILKAQLGIGVNVSLSGSGAAYDRDGDLDNLIIAHEYGHGISNRLTGGPSNVNCLNNAEQMGEGWSDWFGLVMTIKPGDIGTKRRGVGTYAIFEPTLGDGIRPSPYTTDMSVNPWTYGDISNTGAISQPHGIGFLWCNMLWEMTWLFIDNYGFDPDIVNGTGGNNLAMVLVTEGMKLQPCSPGFVTGRNAILQADMNLYGGIHQCLIWQAFAKRGLGLSASQGSANNRTDGSEAYDIPAACALFPVEWQNITATPLTQSIRVDWTIAQESNNAGFSVERRAENEFNFQPISFVQGRGNAESSQAYNYPDLDVEPGITYEYRLRQIDFDGGANYSEVVSARIELEHGPSVRFYPNPSNGQIQLEVRGLEGDFFEIAVLDLIGKTVFAQTGVQGTSQLDLSALPKGTYLLKIGTGQFTEVKKLILR